MNTDTAQDSPCKRGLSTTRWLRQWEDTDLLVYRNVASALEDKTTTYTQFD